MGDAPVNHHLNHLYLFMGKEKAAPEERIRGLNEDVAAGVLAPGSTVLSEDINPGTQSAEVQDEVSST